MERGTNIAAVTAQAPLGDPAAEPLELTAAAELASDPWWDELQPRMRRPWYAIIAASLAALAVIGWTLLFAAANAADLRSGGSAAQWAGWLRDWSVPVLLVAVLWLVAMRNSRREAARFGATAQLLGDASAALEIRLTTVNRELSLAREFIASQSRDIDSLGRVATERLSQHSERLAELIHDNSSRVDAIGDVSTAALENMEKLRGQLPVIASSAKDVSNNIAAAGRSAHAQVSELVSGFQKLNDFGQASERQVKSLGDLIGESIAEFTRQTDQMGQIADQRFAQINASGDTVRAELDSHEVIALAAVRSRAAALTEELIAARAVLDTHEAESLTSLRARLGAVRDESAGLVRALRDGESGAMEAWQAAIAKLEKDLRGAITQVGEIDRKAMEAARARLTELTEEARQVDERLAERDRVFADELVQRRSEFDLRHQEFVDQLAGQMSSLDAAAARQRSVQGEQLDAIQDRQARIGVQLDQFTGQIAALSEQGGHVEHKLSSQVEIIAQRLNASREAIAGTDSAVSVLTDNAVRLLELIQASVQHSEHNLPAAMVASEARLAEIEGRIQALHTVSGEAAANGERLLSHAEQSSQTLAGALVQIAALHGQIATGSAKNGADLDAMQRALATVRSESLGLAEHAQGELKTAIDLLSSSAREAVVGIETMSAASISALAARIGDESGTAIDLALRERAALVAGHLEEASAKASSVSREAAVLLRDQLAKVNDLAGNLERRVAHARTRAEEQVDHDFARRVALITESLNSNAIDIARALDSDVSDTAWAAYLKGDRGIFTRRAVRLLDAPEAKAVAQIYESDRDFREHVSRYIHDFEGMLRQLLSTRDGHALGVTLLSSDMGKLYVALAQSIERLRN